MNWLGPYGGQKLYSFRSITTLNIPDYTWIYQDLYQNSEARHQSSNAVSISHLKKWKRNSCKNTTKVLPSFFYTRKEIHARILRKLKFRKRPSPKQQKYSSPLFFKKSFLENIWKEKVNYAWIHRENESLESGQTYEPHRIE